MLGIRMPNSPQVCPLGKQIDKEDEPRMRNTCPTPGHSESHRKDKQNVFGGASFLAVLVHELPSMRCFPRKNNSNSPLPVLYIVNICIVILIAAIIISLHCHHLHRHHHYHHHHHNRHHHPKHHHHHQQQQ